LLLTARVSSADQRDDVERQAGRVAEEAGKRGITLDATVTEVGSGVNGDRAELRKILADPRVSGWLSTATGLPGSVSSTGKRHARSRAAGSWW
jgi:predicted site-specific integrase-resolvase